METPKTADPLYLWQRIEHMAALGKIAEQTYLNVVQMEPGEISDTLQVSGHQFSTVDEKAKLAMRQEIQTLLGKEVGCVLEESDIPRDGVGSESIIYPLIVGDSVEGSTNAKRWLRSNLARATKRPLMAGTSIMLLEKEKLGSIAATAFYDWASKNSFTSVRGEKGEYLSFINQRLVLRSEIDCAAQDNQPFAIVPGYSNSNVRDRGMLESALQQSGISTDGGSRSSAQDLLNLLTGQADAYVDLRNLFSGSTQNRDEVLRAWDVGALLPVLDGLGFTITNEREQSWQEYSFFDSLALIVTRRRELWVKIRSIIQNLPFMAIDCHEENATVKITPPTITTKSTPKGGSAS